MKDRGKERFSLSELAGTIGVPPRTVRFYIARGLLPGPHKAGRGAAYGREHMERLRLIRERQAAGQTLAEIGMHLAEPDDSPLAPAAARWTELEVAEDVVLMVRDDAGPWRVHQVRKAAGELKVCLEKQERTKEEMSCQEE